MSRSLSSNESAWSVVRTGASYLSHSPLELTFGLGEAEGVERVAIRWPDGTQESIEGVAAGQRYQIVQGEGIVGTVAFSKL